MADLNVAIAAISERRENANAQVQQADREEGVARHHSLHGGLETQGVPCQGRGTPSAVTQAAATEKHSVRDGQKNGIACAD